MIFIFGSIFPTILLKIMKDSPSCRRSSIRKKKQPQTAATTRQAGLASKKQEAFRYEHVKMEDDPEAIGPVTTKTRLRTTHIQGEQRPNKKRLRYLGLKIFENNRRLAQLMSKNKQPQLSEMSSSEAETPGEVKLEADHHKVNQFMSKYLQILPVNVSRELAELAYTENILARALRVDAQQVAMFDSCGDEKFELIAALEQIDVHPYYKTKTQPTPRYVRLDANVGARENQPKRAALGRKHYHEDRSSRIEGSELPDMLFAPAGEFDGVLGKPIKLQSFEFLVEIEESEREKLSWSASDE